MLSSKKLIKSENEWEAVKLENGCQNTLLVQFGSKSCPKCPEATEALEKLRTEYHFEWLYSDAHDDESTLSEFFEVTKLPAVAIVYHDASAGAGDDGDDGEERKLVFNNVSTVELSEIVAKSCKPIFTTDIDF